MDKKAKDKARKDGASELFNTLIEKGFDILQTKDNTCYIPLTTDDGIDYYAKIVYSIPNGAKGSNLDEDIENEYHDYQQKVAKAEKAKQESER